MDETPELGDRVEELLAAPVAAAFVVLADRYGLDADRLAEPGTATALLSDALRELNPWSGSAATDRERFLREAPPLRGLLADVTADPRNAWWSAPLRRDAQLLLLDQRALADGAGADPFAVPVPGGPNDWWEDYAQRPLHHVSTTTELPLPAEGPASEVRSGAHAELRHGVSDWDAEHPVQQLRLRVAPSARVLEVHSAADWHRVVAGSIGDDGPVREPELSDPGLWQSAGLVHGPAPVWSRVAERADAVHVSLAGLLRGLYVPVTSPAVGTTTLWAWYWESTWWLRSAFTDVEELDPLTEPPDDSGRFPH